MSIKKPKPGCPLGQGDFTCINNLLIDKIMPTLPANAWKILTFIIRRAVGCAKDREALSYKQIKKGTGIRSDSTVCKMLLILAQKCLICISSPGDWRSNHYRLNRNLSIYPHGRDAPFEKVEPPHNLVKDERSTPKYEVEAPRQLSTPYLSWSAPASSLLLIFRGAPPRCAPR